MSRLLFPAAALVLAALAAPAVARGPRVASSSALADAQDILAAEAAGLVNVKFIPNDSRTAQVVVTNRSDRPLTLRLPAGFAGVPVLAQMGGGMQGGGMQGGGFGAGGIGGGAQNVGGGGMGGGPFSLPPERTRTLRVPTVCLDHGKREPTPRIAYRMTALENCSTDPRLQDVMACLSSGAISQKVAQAAAWHISSGLTWQQLSAEMIVMAGGTPDVPFFTPAELAAARRLVEESTSRHPPVASESSDSSAG